jgi:hypothetical protein
MYPSVELNATNRGFSLLFFCFDNKFNKIASEDYLNRSASKGILFTPRLIDCLHHHHHQNIVIEEF